MGDFLARVRALPAHQTARHLAFGDLFLEDVRQYRERLLTDARPGKRSDFTPVFPLWGADTDRLARTMIEGGLQAVVNAVDPALAPETLAGRWFDRQFLADLPPGVDALGENGEFHTCVLDGPMFSSPVAARPGRVVRRPVAGDNKSEQRFTIYADLASATDS